MRSIQQAIRDAGGEWIGVQTAFQPWDSAAPQIVFRHPRTKKVVVLRFNPILDSAEKMYEKVLAVLTEGYPSPMPSLEPQVTVPLAALLKLGEILSDASKEITALCKQEKKK
jgi:hypothetical protein